MIPFFSCESQYTFWVVALVGVSSDESSDGLRLNTRELHNDLNPQQFPGVVNSIDMYISCNGW